MNHAFRTTLLMLIIAIVAAFAASRVYPWPQPVIVSEAVNKPLFEDFNTRNVRSIRIETYNDDRSELERLLVRRKGEEWVLPTHNNFVADNGQQLGAVVNLLLDKTVLEKRSDTQEDHLKYGVLDPADINSTVNRSSLGKKISLSDRNNKDLASLIVGLPVKNDPKKLKHYVRIPGQPSVYVVEIDPVFINPDFRAWVSPNLLKLTRSTRLKDITVENYRLDPQKIGSGSRESSYRSQVILDDKNVEVKLEMANENGQLNDSEPDRAQQQAIQQAAGSIITIPFIDAATKSKLAYQALRKADSETAKTAFDSMKLFGFLATEFDNQTWQFESTGGSVSVRTADGVVVTIYIGMIDNQARNNSLKLNHYVMLTAGFDESLIPEPEKTNGEDAETDDVENDDTENEDAAFADDDSSQNKAYLRKVAERDRQLKIGQQRATTLNESFSRWYYIVSEDVISRLRPELIDTTF